MPIEYNPADASNCLPAGDYDAVLTKVVDDKSKKTGQPMQVWHITVYNDAGKQFLVKEYVTRATSFKIRDLAKALGLEAEFKANRFQADDHEASNFRVNLKIEQQDGYDEQNKINRYLPPLKSPSFPESKTPKHSNLGAGLAAHKPVREQPTGKPVPPYGDEKTIPDEDIPF